jgi:hypothetical protein
MPGVARGKGTGRLFTHQSEIDGAVVRIRRRSFCLLRAWEDPAGKPVPLLVQRVPQIIRPNPGVAAGKRIP